jgi:hypothetical protein
MRARLLTFGFLWAMTLHRPFDASAFVYPGDTAPDFTKTELDAPPPAERSLSQYAGKVVVLFLLGYN